jgi:hypothetical protein
MIQGYQYQASKLKAQWQIGAFENTTVHQIEIFGKILSEGYMYFSEEFGHAESESEVSIPGKFWKNCYKLF